MSFHFSKQIPELKTLLLEIRQLEVTIGSFEHKYNNIESSVIFDTRPTDSWKLIFIKKIQGTLLELPILKGFRFTIDSDEKYREFINYFNISGKRGAFSLNDFIKNLGNQVPLKYVISDDCRKAILKYDNLDSKSEGIYPIRIINWPKIHAKNPKLPSDKFHRSPENLAKTKELYPNIYQATKSCDITIVYGSDPNSKTNSIIVNPIP